MAPCPHVFIPGMYQPPQPCTLTKGHQGAHHTASGIVFDSPDTGLPSDYEIRAEALRCAALAAGSKLYGLNRPEFVQLLGIMEAYLRGETDKP